MTGRHRQNAGTSAWVGVLSSMAFAQNAYAEDAASAQSAIALEEVVVTANRRAQDVEEVPLAITVLSSETILRERVQSTADLGRLAPFVSDAGLSALAGGGLTIRGVRGNDRSAGADPPNALFIDGVYFGRPEDGDALLFDLEHIEVLRGPQGTLFGKNVVGGAVVVTTRAPSDKPRALLSVTRGNFDRAEGQASVCGPFGERLRGCLAVMATSADGSVGNTGTGNRLMGTWRRAARGRLDFQATPKFASSLAATYERQRDAGLALYELARPALSEAIYPSNLNIPSQAAQDIDGYRRRHAYSVAATQSYAGDRISFKSITAYRASGSDTRYDADATLAPLFEVVQRTDYRQLSQEVQISSLDDMARLSWVAGLYFLRATTDQLTSNLIRPLDRSLVATLNRQLGFGAGPHLTPHGQDLTAASYAAFGQASLELTERLRLTGGLRYTVENKKGLSQTFGDRDVSLFLGTPELPLPSQGGPLTGRIFANLDRTWNALTPRLALDYMAWEDTMVYVSASKGFKGGGFTGQNTTQAAIERTLNPEYAWSYEAGIKSRLLSDRARFNAALYQMDYSNLQVTTIIGPSRVTDNAASAQIQGLELEAEILATRRLRASLSYAYTDATYQNYIDGSGRDLTGRRFPGVSPHAVSATAGYTLPKVAGGSVTASAGLNYRSRRPNNSVNSPEIYARAVMTWDATVSYRRGELELQLWGRNLTERRTIVYANDVTAFFHATSQPASATLSTFLAGYSPPRTFGATLTWRRD